jgi:WD40 repeat protein
MLILEGHSGAVLSVAYAPDSRTLASGGSDQSVRLWDLGSGSARLVIPNAGDVVLSLAFSPDGQRLAVGTHSRVTLWDLTTRQAGSVQRGGFPGTYLVTFTPDSRIAVEGHYLSPLLSVWDTVADDMLGALSPCPRTLALAHALDRPLLVSGGGAPNGGELFVWDMTNHTRSSVLVETVRLPYSPFYGPPREQCEVQAAHAGAVYSVAISPDARLIASGGKDQLAKIWERETGRVRFRLSGHRGTVVAVSFPPDGRTLLTADESGTIRLWDVDTGKQQASWDWKIGQLRSVVFAPDGMTAAAGGNNRALVWDID